MPITIQSPAFANGEPIPARHTGDGRDASPPLRWSGVPENTQELALIVDDPDAPSPQPWVHWVLCKIPPATTQLPEGVSASATPSQVPGGVQGTNSWRGLGYRGPAPPRGHGTHHYHFALYALDRTLDLLPGVGKDEFLKQALGHIIDQGELVGTYER